MIETSKQRILIIDDEADLCRLLSFNLTEAGFAAEAVTSGNAGLRAVQENRPAVVVLDVMLPDISGTEVCRALRADPSTSDVGILMLTARGEEIDRVVGLELGADDYVVKPFSVREVVLRVRLLARRSAERSAATGQQDTGRRLRWRELEVDPVRHEVLASGVELVLRPIEFKLIVLLLENPSRVYSRADLLGEIWGEGADVAVRTIDTHVKRLRDALGPFGEAVETVHGFGYRLREG